MIDSALERYYRTAAAERDGLRAELATCNQALEVAQTRISALEKVAEAARTIFASLTPAIRQLEMVRLLDALAALDTEPAHICKCGGKCKEDGND